MTVIVKHNKTNSITDWTQAQLDEQIALGNFPSGTTLANIVLPSDWNNDHTLTGLGTMAEQNANSVAITGGTINNTTIGATTATTGRFTSVTTPSVTATTNDLTLSAISTGKINLNTATANQVQITDSAVSAGQYTLLSRDNAGNEQRVSAAASSGGVNLGLSSAVAGAVKFYTNGFAELQAQVSRTASAVNYVQVTGGATGNATTISAQGSDGNIFMQFNSKGTSGFNFYSGGGSFRQLRIDGANSSVNFLGIAGSVANQVPILNVAAASSDTNVSLAIQPKGTGAIDLAAGSSGVNISNGGTVTAITRTATGSGYTSIPSVAISAPTTAGGVQATASVASMVLNNPTTIFAGGTGYTVGDVLTMVGGTLAGGSAGTYTVTSVSAGVVTGVTVNNFANYSVLPTNPVSTTGGTGTGARLNSTYGINASFTITNAGSGYIEQPTITFSGGGGSGAAAYATVGSPNIIRGIGGYMDFYTPNGISFRVQDSGTTSSAYWTAYGTSGGAIFRGTSASSVAIQSATAVPIQFTTNTSAEQMRVAHTASAVNYVQVTGSATTGSVVISSQGSDTNVGLQLRSKGTGDINLMTAGGTNQVVVRNVASAVNYLSLKGSAAGNMVPIQVEGTDTNIDLALTPKGTGLVRFGTYVAGALLATGYINIKAADGTTYKVLVST